MKPLTDGGRRLAATVPVVLLLAAAMSQLQVTMQEQMISLVCAEHRANDSPGNTTSCQSMAVLDEVTPPPPPRLHAFPALTLPTPPQSSLRFPFWTLRATRAVPRALKAFPWSTGSNAPKRTRGCGSVVGDLRERLDRVGAGLGWVRGHRRLSVSICKAGCLWFASRAGGRTGGRADGRADGRTGARAGQRGGVGRG